jgi:hypothetical protein
MLQILFPGDDPLYDLVDGWTISSQNQGYVLVIIFDATLYTVSKGHGYHPDY